MEFLTNPKTKKTRKTKRKGRFAKGSKAAKAWGRKMKALRSGKGGSTVARKRTKKRKTTKRRTYKRNQPVVVNRKRSHRRFKRNPGMGRGVFSYMRLSTLTDGLTNAAEVLAGEVAIKRLPGMVGLPTDGNMGLVVKAGTSLLIGGVAHTFVSPNAGKMVLAGALADTIKSAAQLFAPDMAAAVLGEDTVLIDGMGTYPQVSQGMGSYVQPMGEQEYNYATVQ